MNAAIRGATEAELPAIVAIYNSTVASRMVTASTEPVSVDSRREWFHAHGAARPLWVAVDGGDVLAWLSLSSFYGRPAYHATVEVSLYVHESHRRRGLGSMLLDHAVARAPAIGVRTLLGFIFAHNAPSLRIFEKHDFHAWGLLPRVAELDGIERDLIIVGRRLS